MLMAFYFLLTYFDKNKSVKPLYLGVIFLAAGMYTYFSHAIIIPFLLIAFIYFFRKNFTGANKKFIFVLSSWILMIIPLLLIIVFNPASRYRSQTVFITQDINLGKAIDYGNKYKAILDFSFNRFLEQFNPVYIFGNGMEFTNQGLLDIGPLLLIQLPFLILGIIYLVKLTGSGPSKRFILAWVFIGMLPSGLTFELHSMHRSIMVFTMLNIVSAAGLYMFLKIINTFQTRFNLIKNIMLIVLSLVFLVNFTYFIHMYFVNFPFEKSQAIHYPFKQVSLFVWSQSKDFDQIIFDPLYGEIAPVVGTAVHYYLAYYGGYPPVDFQKGYQLGKKEREVIFDKFSIRKIDWREDQYLKNVLIVGSPWSLPIQSLDKSKILKVFYFYNGQPAFYAVKL